MEEKIIVAFVVLFILYMMFKDDINSYFSCQKQSMTTSAVLSDPSRKIKYMFYGRLDSPGYDIGRFPGTIPELKAKCESLPNCKGFNDNGWLKYKIQPITFWRKFSNDRTKGFRIYADRLPGYPSSGIPEYD